MRNSVCKQVDLRNFYSQKALSYPAGYICLIGDVDYGNRYLLIRVNAPVELKKRLRESWDFETRLARAWQADDAEAAERKLRAEYSRGAASDEWFDLDESNASEIEEPAPSQRPPQQPRRDRSPRATVYPTVRPPRSLKRIATVTIATLMLFALVTPRFDGLRSRDHHGRAMQRHADSRSTSAVRPESPASVTVKLTETRMRFNWARVDDVDGYEVSYRVNGGRNSTPYRTRELRASARLPAPGAVVEFQVIARRGMFRSKPARLTLTVPGEKAPEAETVETGRSRNRGGERMFVTAWEGYTVHVRECSSTSCAVIGRLQNGQWITVLEVVDGETVAKSSQWARFDHDGRDGYVYLPLLSPLTRHPASS